MRKQETNRTVHLKEIKERNQFGPETPPFDRTALGRTLGELINVEYLCPGVYFITALNKSLPLALQCH